MSLKAYNAFAIETSLYEKRRDECIKFMNPLKLAIMQDLQQNLSQMNASSRSYWTQSVWNILLQIWQLTVGKPGNSFSQHMVFCF